MIKTLIVDDSPLVRDILRDFLESEGSFQIIGEGENGQDGVRKALQLSPDLITMDIEMPVMNGLQAIDVIVKAVDAEGSFAKAPAIVVISTHDTAKMAYDATVRGAKEFFAKDIFTSQMSNEKRGKIINTLKHITSINKKNDSFAAHRKQTIENINVAPRKIKAIVIASSTGGPMALCQLFTSLPADFPVPVILVQHNTSGFDKGFVQWLNGYTGLNVVIAEDKMVLEGGNVYVAPTDKHLVIGEHGIALDDSEPVNNQKPAADLLFKSGAELYGSSLLSVVLTGMGSDGAEGSRYVKQAGGITISQDEATSMIYGMPQAAAATGCIDMILPLGDISKKLIELAGSN